MPRQKPREQSLALGAARHGSPLESRCRLEPRRGHTVIELDAIYADSVAPEGLDRRKGSEHRHDLLKEDDHPLLTTKDDHLPRQEIGRASGRERVENDVG